MFCVHCGKEISEEAVICPCCGKIVNEEKIAEVVSRQENPIGISNDWSKKVNNGGQNEKQ